MTSQTRSNTKKNNLKAETEYKSKDSQQSTVYKNRRIMQVAIQACTVVAIIGAIVIGILLYYHKQTSAVWVTFGTIVAVTLGFCLFWQDNVWKEQSATNQQVTIQTSKAQTPAVPLIPKTLHDFFKTDFNNLLRFTKSGTMTIKDETTFKDKDVLNYEAQIYADFDAQSVFLGFYISESQHTYTICEYIYQNYENILLELQTAHVEVEVRSPVDRPVELKYLNFSGRIFIYHEYPLFTSQIENLITLYKTKNLHPQFRRKEYAYALNSSLK